MAREISLQEVRHMAMLSRLTISEAEEKLFSQQFGQILGHVQVLEKVNTDGVEPLYSPVQHLGEKREDDACNTRDRAEILANAPETDGECFIVPRIV